MADKADGTEGLSPLARRFLGERLKGYDPGVGDRPGAMWGPNHTEDENSRARRELVDAGFVIAVASIQTGGAAGALSTYRLTEAGKKLKGTFTA